jgi:hypothetical protein
MPPRTPIPVVTVDPSKPAWEQETPLHNRWHPEVPAVGGRARAGRAGAHGRPRPRSRRRRRASRARAGRAPYWGRDRVRAATLSWACCCGGHRVPAPRPRRRPPNAPHPSRPAACRPAPPPQTPPHTPTLTSPGRWPRSRRATCSASSASTGLAARSRREHVQPRSGSPPCSGLGRSPWAWAISWRTPRMRPPTGPAPTASMPPPTHPPTQRTMTQRRT